MSSMIHAVRSNHNSFKEVGFRPGFNAIVADRTEISGMRDSRNGLGKSTLIEIIHFCLGSSARKGSGLIVANLRGWAFSLDLTIADQDFVVTRSIDEPSKILIDGNTINWSIQPRVENGQQVLSLKEWTTALGSLMFGLPIFNEHKEFSPTFRGLISYFIRRGPDAYSTPFEHFRRQPEWDKQVNNAFLLELSWENARELQLLKEQEKLLDSIRQLKENSQDGVVTRVLGSLGELEAAKVRIEQQLRSRQEALSNFRVHPQYNELEKEVDRLTVELHEITNDNLVDRRLLSFYQSSLETENEPDSNDVVQIYQNAGVELPNLVIRRLEEVENFHHQLIENRRVFLATEIARLRRSISTRERLIREKTEQRASRLEILRIHGALEEYTRLQSLYLETVSALNEINQRIEEIKRVEEGKSALRIEKELLIQRMRRDNEERHTQIERAIRFFNSNSQALYDAPGVLIIDIGPNGFRFKVDIERDRSEGIGKMKIFCYDLMLAQLWAQRAPSPNILIHDSTIFDGVDERQRALALELAARESAERGFQYICMLNTDMIPKSLFPPDWDFDSFVRLTLTDDEGGNLLGMDF